MQMLTRYYGRKALLCVELVFTKRLRLHHYASNTFKLYDLSVVFTKFIN
jgi:hypothetical protein